MIFINHVPGNAFEWLASNNYGFSDAAEIFVFLAGYASAYAYSADLAGGHFAAGVKRVAHRVLQIYAAHLISAAAAIAIIATAAWQANDPTYHEWINLAPIFHNTAAAVTGMLLLTHQPGYFNILPLYIVLLAALPLAFLVLRGGQGLLLLASGSLWLIANLTHVNLPHYPNGDHWFLDPFAWQLMFTLGLVAGLRAKSRVPVVAFSPVLFGLSVLYLAFSLWAVEQGSWLSWDLGPADFVIAWDKAYLPPARLLHFICLAYAVACIAGPKERFLGRAFQPLVLLGQHSLPVFCLGSVVAIGAQVLRFERDGGLADDVLLIGCGILLQLTLAAYLAQKKRPKLSRTVSVGAEN